MSLGDLFTLQGTLFAMILVGMFLRKRGIIDESGKKCLYSSANIRNSLEKHNNNPDYYTFRHIKQPDNYTFRHIRTNKD